MATLFRQILYTKCKLNIISGEVSTLAKPVEAAINPCLMVVSRTRSRSLLHEFTPYDGSPSVSSIKSLQINLSLHKLVHKSACSKLELSLLLPTTIANYHMTLYHCLWGVVTCLVTIRQKIKVRGLDGKWHLLELRNLRR